MLLLAYPKGPRRDEVLDTLTMAAEAGGRRPQTLNLIRYGLRARLGRPRSRTIVALSVLLAIAGGFLAASVTNRIIWEAGPELPGEARAAEIAGLVAPGLRLELYGGDAFGDGPFGYAPGEEVSARSLHQRTSGRADTRDVAGFMTGVRQRVEAAGWRITEEANHDGEPLGTGRWFTARQDGLILSVSDNYTPADGTDFLIVSLGAAEPAWISVVTVTGGLLGAIGAWLLAAWASRTSEHARGTSVPAGAAAWFGLLLLWPALYYARAYLPEVVTGGYEPGYPFWANLTWQSEYGPPTALAVIMFATALGLALAGRRFAPDPSPVAG